MKKYITGGIAALITLTAICMMTGQSQIGDSECFRHKFHGSRTASDRKILFTGELQLYVQVGLHGIQILFLPAVPAVTAGFTTNTVSIATLAEKRARLLRAVHATGRYRPVDQLFVHPDCFGSLRIRENTQLPARRFRRLPAHFRIDPAVLPTRIPVLRSLRRSDNHILHRIVRPFVRIETFRPFSFEKIYP